MQQYCMFAINFIVLLDILELNLMPLLSRQRYFFRMISQYNFIALLVAQLSSITLVKRTMHFTMIMYIKACNFCYGSSILTRIYTMPLTCEGRELCRKLFGNVQTNMKMYLQRHNPSISAISCTATASQFFTGLHCI